MTRALLAAGAIAAALLLRMPAGAAASPDQEECVQTDPVVVLGMELLPSQEKCVPIP